MEDYAEYLKQLGMSANTLRKYLHDADLFVEFQNKREITPELLNDYKMHLLENHSASSVKSMIIAANKYLVYIGSPYHIDHKDISFSSQKASKAQLTNEEYTQLLNAARSFSDDRMYMLIKTLCSAGLQVSELKYVTVRGIHNEEITIPCSKHLRTVYLPKKLCSELKNYCWERKILDGPIFISNRGNPMDRSNILKNMKKICDSAGIDSKKVFPQELKNLHVRTYDKMMQEIIDQMVL